MSVRGTAYRTAATARYLGGDVVRSQRFLLPVVVFAAVLAVLFGGDAGPPPLPWAASTLVAYPAAAWIALVVANTEDAGQRTVTVASAGGRGIVAVGTLLVALAGDLLISALSVAWPVFVTPYAYPVPLLLFAATTHLAAATTGTAVGLLCARPVVPRIGWSFVIGLSVVVVTGVQPWLPPVGTAVQAIVAKGPAPIGSALLGLALAVSAAAVSFAVDRTR